MKDTSNLLTYFPETKNFAVINTSVEKGKLFINENEEKPDKSWFLSGVFCLIKKKWFHGVILNHTETELTVKFYTTEANCTMNIPAEKNWCYDKKVTSNTLL